MNLLTEAQKRLTTWWKRKEEQRDKNPSTRLIDENDPKFPEKDFRRLSEIFFKSDEVIRTLNTAGWVEIEEILLEMEKGFTQELITQENERVRGKIELLQELFTRLEQSKARRDNALGEVGAKGYDIMFTKPKKEEEVI